MPDVAVFKSEVKPDWWSRMRRLRGVLNSLVQKACADLNLNPHDVMVVSGIGCSSNLPGFFNSYGMHTLHGRSIAVAQGAKFGRRQSRYDSDCDGRRRGRVWHWCRTFHSCHPAQCRHDLAV